MACECLLERCPAEPQSACVLQRQATKIRRTVVLSGHLLTCIEKTDATHGAVKGAGYRYASATAHLAYAGQAATGAWIPRDLGFTPKHQHRQVYSAGVPRMGKHQLLHTLGLLRSSSMQNHAASRPPHCVVACATGLPDLLSALNLAHGACAQPKRMQDFAS